MNIYKRDHERAKDQQHWQGCHLAQHKLCPYEWRLPKVVMKKCKKIFAFLCFFMITWSDDLFECGALALHCPLICSLSSTDNSCVEPIKMFTSTSNALQSKVCMLTVNDGRLRTVALRCGYASANDLFILRKPCVKCASLHSRPNGMRSSDGRAAVWPLLSEHDVWPYLQVYCDQQNQQDDA